MADRETNPLVDQIRKGGVPLEVRMMAAEGALPLKPEDLVDLLEVMHRDPLPEVSTLATKTFSELSVDTLLPLVKARDAVISVLSWTLEVRTEPRILNGSRRSRIAKGSGSTVSDVNSLIERFGRLGRCRRPP